MDSTTVLLSLFLVYVQHTLLLPRVYFPSGFWTTSVSWRIDWSIIPLLLKSIYVAREDSQRVAFENSSYSLLDFLSTDLCLRYLFILFVTMPSGSVSSRNGHSCVIERRIDSVHTRGRREVAIRSRRDQDPSKGATFISYKIL